MAAEAEPIVRALAACIEARIPAAVVPLQGEPEDFNPQVQTLAEMVEFTLDDMRKNFSRIDRIVPESSVERIDQAALRRITQDVIRRAVRE